MRRTTMVRLGYVGVSRALIAGKVPLDHVNYLGWTELIETGCFGG